ncbi:uncharacterized protein LOC132759047, partial [Ruditapes philippinarum]|uniref:uncharacterized protein LOC132759047 n=1 Tax=Ruditapes philippinarum TaxID=129788 RepID=UPI00295C0566
MLSQRSIAPPTNFVGVILLDTEDDGYSGEVKVLFQDLKDFRSNVEKAQRKMATFPYETMDRKYAIGLINLYTQDSNFYRKLNEEMRSNYPTKTDIWQRSGDLINRGIDILGRTKHKIVYRGCIVLNGPPEKGRNFKFNQITSTTLIRELAQHFADDGCHKGKLFEISNVDGLLAEEYSDFRNEKEVLIKSYYVFKVIEESQTTTEDIYKLEYQPESTNFLMQ